MIGPSSPGGRLLAVLFLLLSMPAAGMAESDLPPDAMRLRDAIWRGYAWLQGFISREDVPERYGGEFMLFHGSLATTSDDARLREQARRDGRRFALRCLKRLARTDLLAEPEACHEAMAVSSLLDAFGLASWGGDLRLRIDGAIRHHGAGRLAGVDALGPRASTDSLYDALIGGHFARKGGFPVGRWLPELIARIAAHPWRPPEELSEEEANGQNNLATHVIYVLSDYGRLRLDPMRFRPEIDLLLEDIDVFIADEDPEGVAECIDCLRILGWPTVADPLPRGLRALLRWQASNGSWCPEGGDEYDHYHATWCAIDALRGYRFQAEGPCWPGWRPAPVTDHERKP